MLNLAVIVQIVGLVAIMIVVNLLIRAEESFERKIMIITCICAFIMNAGYLSELISPTLEAALASVKMEYFGTIWVNFSLMIFVFRFCHVKTNKIFVQVMTCIETIITLMVFTNDIHHFLYEKAEFVSEPLFPHLKLTYGPLYYIHLAILLVIVGTSIGTIIKFYFYSKRTKANLKKLWMLKYIVVAPIIPFFGMALFYFKILRVYDVAPILTLLVSGAIIVIMLRHNIFDLTDTARNAIIRNMDAAIIILDEYYNLQQYNDSAAEVFPELSNMVAGSKISQMHSVPFDVFSNLSEEGTEFNIDKVYFRCIVNPIYDEDGEVRGYVAAFRDVTAQKEEAMIMADIQRRYDGAVKVKDNFLANMSHEIRTPMNAIIGMSDLIMAESAGGRTNDYASDIKVASQSLLQIVDDIFDATKMGSDKLELREVDYYLAPILTESCIATAAMAEEKGISFKKEIDESLPCKLHGDINRVRQIITNLLSNAVKYTSKGYVELDVDYDKVSEDSVRIRITARDTGIGIKPMDLDRIFETFSQLDSEVNREAQGLGLGLSISKRLADAMGGDLSVVSEYGKGSDFTATIIQKVVDWTSISEKPSASDAADNERRAFTAPDARILIVDDNKINIKVVRGLLKPYQYIVDDVLSGFDALAAVDRNTYDIIFMDHMMPEMDGVETTKCIRSGGGEMPIIALTANTQKDAEAMFLSNGFQDVVFKPIDRERLDEVLDRWTPGDKKIYGAEGVFAVDPGIPQIPFTRYINFDEGLARSPLGFEDFISILDLYYEDGKEKKDYIRQLFEKKDYENYTIEVHALKSASYNIAAHTLGDMAKEHEYAGKDGRYAFIEDNVDELLDLYEKVLSEIKSILDTAREKEKKPKRSGIALSGEELKLMTGDILSSVRNFKSKEAKEKLNALLDFDIPEDIYAKLSEIGRLLKMYEDEKAEECLAELIDNI